MAEHLQSGNYGNKRNNKKKEENVSLVVQGQAGRWSNNAPSIRAQGNNPLIQQLVFNQNNNRRRRYEDGQNRKFTPLREPLENILALLIAKKKITELLPLADPKRSIFDSSNICAYHLRLIYRAWYSRLLVLEAQNSESN